ncbi:MAG: hypothetical protein Q8R38_02370, partial [Candidatus Omnitrophota bacterium]|nr:hypothetical protein [Candidatus Omnitrophota bacterium]
MRNAVLSVIVIFGLLVTAVFAQEQDPSQIQTQSQPKVSDTDGKISLDLKGIDIVELLRVLSLKTGLT